MRCSLVDIRAAINIGKAKKTFFKLEREQKEQVDEVLR